MVELGSGTGFGTPLLVERYGRVVAMDLSLEMLRHADIGAGRGRPGSQADALAPAALDGAVAALVLVNMLLFPGGGGAGRGPGGVVVWVNSLGERTPIHLPGRGRGSAMARPLGRRRLAGGRRHLVRAAPGVTRRQRLDYEHVFD